MPPRNIDVILQAWQDKRPAKRGNYSTDGESIYIHGNRIASRTANGAIKFTLAGWNTPMTRRALNEFLRFVGSHKRIHCIQDTPYINGDIIEATEEYEV